jgi:hypothetical protein
MDTAVSSPQPRGELGVEVLRAREPPARQEAGLEILVGPLDQALGLGVAGLAHDDAHGEGSPETLERRSERCPAVVAAHQRRLVVIDTLAGHAAEVEQTGEVARQDVMGFARGDHAGHDRARVARHPDDHRQGRQLSLAERNPHRREPQIPLGELAGSILGALTRVSWHEQRPQFAHPVLQDRHRTVPANALSDHRRRHARKLLQQLPDRRLPPVDSRRSRLAVEHWRPVRAQRHAHRVASNAQPPRDLLDRQSFSPVQPSDLSQVLHVEHFLPPQPQVGPGSVDPHVEWWTQKKKGQKCAVDKGSVFSRRRQAPRSVWPSGGPGGSHPRLRGIARSRSLVMRRPRHRREVTGPPAAEMSFRSRPKTRAPSADFQHPASRGFAYTGLSSCSAPDWSSWLGFG